MLEHVARRLARFADKREHEVRAARFDKAAETLGAVLRGARDGELAGELRGEARFGVAPGEVLVGATPGLVRVVPERDVDVRPPGESRR